MARPLPQERAERAHCNPAHPASPARALPDRLSPHAASRTAPRWFLAAIPTAGHGPSVAQGSPSAGTGPGGREATRRGARAPAWRRLPPPDLTSEPAAEAPASAPAAQAPPTACSAAWPLSGAHVAIIAPHEGEERPRLIRGLPSPTDRPGLQPMGSQRASARGWRRLDRDSWCSSAGGEGGVDAARPEQLGLGRRHGGERTPRLGRGRGKGRAGPGVWERCGSSLRDCGCTYCSRTCRQSLGGSSMAGSVRREVSLLLLH